MKMPLNKKSFTIIEMLLAIFLLSVAIGGILGLIFQFISLTSFSSQNLIASYLAQEGIEIVRNIRDTNFLAEREFDEGLDPGDYQADYNDFSLSPYDGAFLKIDSSGFFNYETGSQTHFQRKISISKPQPDILEVRVFVFWQERGRSHQIVAQENLYNFR